MADSVDVSKLVAPSTPPTNATGLTGIKRGLGTTTIDTEFLPELRGPRGRDILHQMANNSPVLGAALHAIRSYLLRAPIVIVPSGDKPRHKKVSDLVSDSLTETIVRDVVDDAAQMMIYGFHLAEIVLERRDGAMHIKKLAPRAARSVSGWVWDEGNDEPVAFWQNTVQGQRMVPLNRCLHFRTTRGEGDNPEGVSLLRSAYTSDFATRRLQEIEGIGIERDLAGLPLLKVPGALLDPSANDVQKKALASFQALLTDMRRDKSEGIILPSDRDDQGNPYFDVSLLAVAGNRQTNISQTIERYEKRAAQSLLAEFLFLGVSGGGTGSYALSDSKTAMFRASLRAFLNQVLDQFRERLVPMIVRFNGYSLDLAPEVRFGDFDKISLDQMGEFVERLTRSGLLTPSHALEENLREASGLPAVTQEEYDEFRAPPELEGEGGDGAARPSVDDVAISTDGVENPSRSQEKHGNVVDLDPILKALAS